MGHTNVRTSASELWRLADRQHGVVSRGQLLAGGLNADSIGHRIASGRLHPVTRGVYAVGRPELSRHGVWTAAVLSCGPDAVLSHHSAAALWGIRSAEGASVEISVPPAVRRSRPGVRVYRRALTARDLTTRQGIPVTALTRTLLDLARTLPRDDLEAAINAADKYDLTNPEQLRVTLEGYAGTSGVATLRTVLDRRTFLLTDSHLERRFLPIARRAGLGPPQTGQRVNGFRVDFYWPDLGLVVETDGLRYHRTPAQQSRDRLRDQAHVTAGLTALRFTHAQVRFEPAHVQSALAAVARRLPRRAQVETVSTPSSSEIATSSE
jgi:very-short-patch-repair endonuclease/predicted transcriptional regulator of viral defense system